MENLELERRIFERRDDPEAYLAYGRWLESVRDPRGELVVLACTDESAERIAELVARQTQELPTSDVPGFSAKWRFGFVDSLSTTIAIGASRLLELLTHPSMRFVRELSVRFYAPGERTDATRELAQVAVAIRNVEQFNLSFGSSVSLDSIERLRGGLWLNGFKASFGRQLALQRLELRCTRVDWHGIFPRLETLVLRPHGEREWLTDVFNDATAVPALRSLHLLGSGGDQNFERLIASPLLRQLDELNLSGALTNAGAARLYAHADRFERLKRIWLGDDGFRRRNFLRMVRTRDPSYEEPPLGEFEIDRGWRSRLRDRLGGRVLFELPAGHPFPSETR